MHNKKIYILTTICLITFLLSGCNNNPAKGKDPTDKSAEKSPILLNAEIANAKFFFLTIRLFG